MMLKMKKARSLKKSPKLSLVRSRSASLRCKPNSNSIERDQRIEFLGGNGEERSSFGSNNEELVNSEGNKVVVVVDSSIAAKGALEWTLTHTIQTQDKLVLLYVTKKGKTMDGKRNLRATQLLQSMKNVCESRRPGVKVDVAMVQGKEKGVSIVQEAKQQSATLLVVGQKKKSIMWRLFNRWAWKRGKVAAAGVADFCIENASCMTIAVRSKSSKVGGYLITTKRHKRFWQLA